MDIGPADTRPTFGIEVEDAAGHASALADGIKKDAVIINFILFTTLFVIYNSPFAMPIKVGGVVRCLVFVNRVV